MKRLVLAAMVALTFFATQSLAIDKTAIKTNVDEIVAALDDGKDPASYAPDAYSPYAFIMEKNGKLIVHPTLSGQDLKEKGMPIFIALQSANAEGKWITYKWNGKEKNTYARMTKSNLIVGSGY